MTQVNNMNNKSLSAEEIADLLQKIKEATVVDMDKHHMDVVVNASNALNEIFLLATTAQKLYANQFKEGDNAPEDKDRALKALRYQVGFYRSAWLCGEKISEETFTKMDKELFEVLESLDETKKNEPATPEDVEKLAIDYANKEDYGSALIDHIVTTFIAGYNAAKQTK